MLWGQADGLGIKLSHELTGNEGANRGTHGCAMDLLKIFTLEEKIGILRQNPSNVIMFWRDIEVLW